LKDTTTSVSELYSNSTVIMQIQRKKVKKDKLLTIKTWVT